MPRPSSGPVPTGKAKQPQVATSAVPRTQAAAEVKARPPASLPQVPGFDVRYAGFGGPNGSKAQAASSKPSSAAASSIERVPYASIGPDEFYKRYVLPRRPAVLTGALLDTDARNDSGKDEFSRVTRWRSAAYLGRRVGDAKVRVEWKVDAAAASSAAGGAPASPAPTQFGRGQHEWMPFSEFLERVTASASAAAEGRGAKHGAAEQQRSLYLTSQPIPSLASGAPKDLCAQPLTSILDDMPLRPSILPQLVPVQYNCWIGGHRGSAGEHDAGMSSPSLPSEPFQAPSPFHRSPGTSSGLHHDYHDNLYLLVQGAKTFYLFPPSMAPAMYPWGMHEKESAKGKTKDAKGKPKAPTCVVHANGLIEYSSAAAATSDEDDAEDEMDEDNEEAPHYHRSKAQQPGKKRKMRPDEEKEEEDEDGEDEDVPVRQGNAEMKSKPTASSSSSSTLNAAADAAKQAFATKLAAMVSQLSELTELRSKASLALQREAANPKRAKHLAQEVAALDKKMAALKARKANAEKDEAERLRKEQEATAQSSHDGDSAEESAQEDDDDDDEGSFPDEDALAQMQDDYEEDAEEEDHDADDGEEAEGGYNDGEGDDEDEQVDPSERAAWEEFMRSTAKGKGKGKATPDSASSESAKKKGGQLVSSSSTPATVASFPPNFSRVDFASHTTAQLRERFPLFVDHARPLVTPVGQGDLLYLPAGWWHEVFSAGASGTTTRAAQATSSAAATQLPSSVHFALNFWYAPPSSSVVLAASKPDSTGAKASPQPYRDREDLLTLKEAETYYLPRAVRMQQSAREHLNSASGPQERAKQDKVTVPAAHAAKRAKLQR